MKTTITISAIVSFIIGLILNITFISAASDYSTKLLIFFIILTVSGISKTLLDIYLNTTQIIIQNEFSLNLMFTSNKDESFLENKKEEYEETVKELKSLVKYSNRLTIILFFINLIVLFMVVNG